MKYFHDMSFAIRPVTLVALCVTLLGSGCSRQAPEPESGTAISEDPAGAAVPAAAPAPAAVPAVDAAARALHDEACKSLGEEPGCTRTIETAVLAGGCFWGMEEILREIDGVLATEVGYTGGGVANPGYSDVKTGNSGHAETVRLLFDPSKLSYADLLEKWFFRMHDPTTKNRQGNDVGSQYRSSIFTTSATQRSVAKAVIKRVDAGGKWGAPIGTVVVDAGAFTRAEDYHQKYLVKNPGGYTCHYLRESIVL